MDKYSSHAEVLVLQRGKPEELANKNTMNSVSFA
jgi:hypothetical protein